MKLVLAAALTLALAAAAPARAQTAFTDWTAVTPDGTVPAVASGSLLGHAVTITGDDLSGSSTTGGWSFPAPAFTPPLADSDEIQLFGTPAGDHYTLSFAVPVTDPVLHIDSLGSTVTFPAGTSLQRVSGDAGFSVAGNQVTGTGMPDPGGTVRLVGTVTQVPMTVVYPGNADGIPTQVGAPVPTATPVPTPAPIASPTPAPVPPPVAGVRVVTAPASGTVRVKLPGGETFTPLTTAAALPVGSVVDARAGSLTVRTTSGSAMVAAGIFTIRQAAARDATAALVLQTPPGQGQACAHVHKGVVRRLTVTSRGVIRTVAAKGVVQGRNATWTVADRCDGTLTRVRKGRVAVTAGHRTKTVRAGHSLLIRARLFRARQNG